MNNVPINIHSHIHKEMPWNSSFSDHFSRSDTLDFINRLWSFDVFIRNSLGWQDPTEIDLE